MLKVTIATVLASLVVIIGGCQTLTTTPEEQSRKYSRISNLNRMMFNEDIDNILLLDKPSQLTRWHIYTE